MANINKRALPLGAVVHGRYRVERVLGEGGFGVTYMVTDMRENRISAMKEYMPVDIAARSPISETVYPQSGCEDSYKRFCNRFLEEARIIYRYRGHPNIIDVQHLFYDNNTAYYVMEFIEGKDLGKCLEINGERLPWDILRPIMAQVATALQEVHRGGMIHCDISPDNIFILDGGRVKLIDFGAAKSVLKSKSSVVLLKRGFAPPEQLSAQGQMGPWTDIYAMAVTIYRAYTGRMPPAAEDRLMNDRTIWPSQMGITPPSRRWEQVLRKAMALRPEERYQNVADFWTELSRSQIAQQNPPVLEGVRGYYEGAKIQIQGEIILGTDRTRCQIPYPAGSPGISRVHMRLWAENGKILVMDMGSTYGTWLGDKRMSPGLSYVLNPGSVLHFGDGQMFRAADCAAH